MRQPVFETTATALREKSKLQRHFRRFDVFFYLICTVVTIDTIGAVASNGAQGFTWLIFLGVLFFLPYALSVAELGSAFPQEGGPYVWSRLAFGRPLAAINSVIYWISNPIWIGGSLTIVSFAAIEEFFGPVGGAGKYVYAVAFITSCGCGRIASSRQTRLLANSIVCVIREIGMPISFNSTALKLAVSIVLRGSRTRGLAIALEVKNRLMISNSSLIEMARSIRTTLTFFPNSSAQRRSSVATLWPSSCG